MPRKIIDLTGQRFGRLTAVKCLGIGGTRLIAQWECKCDCGKTAIAYGADLRAGTRISCGCGRKQPRKPKAEKCVVCGVDEIRSRNMCKYCYMKWWKEKRKIEMEELY